MMTRLSKTKWQLSLMAAALVASGVGISAASAANSRARHVKAPVKAVYNYSTERGSGPAPTGQYPSFEKLDRFPGSGN